MRLNLFGRRHPKCFTFALFALCSSVTNAQTSSDGALLIEVIAPANFVVDKNGAGAYAPSSAHLGVKVCNTGATPLTQIRSYIGNGITPGTYPTVAPTGRPYSGNFALDHVGTSADAARSTAALAPGACVTQYWLVEYPRADASGNSILGGNTLSDDLALGFTVWATASEGATARSASLTKSVTCRGMISAMANKIYPNGSNKVPAQYLDAIESVLGWRPSTDTEAGSVNTTEGIWFDLGRVNKGLDNDGDFAPDYNVFLQPVGDPAQFDPGCFRLVRTYGLIIVKKTDGTEKLIPFVDQSYFSNLPPDNNGAVGLVFYEFAILNAPCAAVLTPYQAAASGADNEKYNGDYGTFTGRINAALPSATVSVSGPSTGSFNTDLLYVVSATNTGTSPLGLLEYAAPLVLSMDIPAGSSYVAGSAQTSGSLPTGISSVEVRYSTDGGIIWTSTEPAAASVTNVQWWPNATLDAGLTFSAELKLQAPVTYTPAIIDLEGGMGFGSANRFATEDVITLMPGINSISGRVFDDTGVGSGTRADGLPNGTEPGIQSTLVTLYYDGNGNGVRDESEVVFATTTSASDGTYSFANLPDGKYIAVVDKPAVLALPSHTGYGMTTDGALALSLDPAHASGTATAATTGYFGFTPALAVSQTASASSVGEGRTVTYTIDVQNLLKAQVFDDGSAGGLAPGCNVYYLGSTAASGAFATPQNVYGLPDATFANSSAKWNDALTGSAFPVPTEASLTGITKVEVISKVYWTDGNQGPNDIKLELPTGTLASAIIPFATFQGFTSPASAGMIVWDVTALRTWTWASFATETIGIGGDNNNGANKDQLFVDVLGFRVTTNGSTTGCGSTFDPITGLVPVPLTHDYDASQLRFVSASVDPSSVDATTGLLSWSSIGQIAAGDVRTITVTYEVLEPAGNVVGSATTLATVTGATLASGDPANDGNASLTITVTPTGSASGLVWSDVNANGWVDANTSYQSGTDFLMAGVKINVISCTVVATNGSCTGVQTTEQTVTTAADGSYTVKGLTPNLHYRLEVVTASLPGTPTQTGDPDDRTGSGYGNGGTCGSGGANAICNAAWNRGTEWFEVGVDSWFGQSWDVTKIDFGYSIQPAIRGTIRGDYDGDGLVDIGDSGLSGVTVELRHAGCTAGVNCPTATTAADGSYSFNNLTAATSYTIVARSFPSGTWAATADSDAGTLNSIAVTAVAGRIMSGYFTAFRPTGTSTVSGDFYYDHSEDALRGSTDEPIANVTVRLYADVNGNGVYDATTDALVTTTSTNATGTYSFANVANGSYVIVVDRSDVDFPTGVLQTQDPDESPGACSACDSKAAVAVTGANVDADFGYKPYGDAAVSGAVFNDQDGSGTRLTGVEAGLAGIAVVLYADYDNNGSFVAVDTAYTTTQGTYAFAKLADGDYRVAVSGSNPNLPEDSAGNPYAATTVTTVNVVVTGGTPATQPSFGFAQLASIGDAIFHDANANGAYDESESGVAGVTVYLCAGNVGSCGSGNAIATTVTADGLGVLPKGAYRFTSLTPGTYTLGVETVSGPLAGNPQTADPDSDGLGCDDPQRASLGYPSCDARYAVTVSYGTIVTGGDFGFEPSGVIGDQIWLDGDADGVIDAGEPGIHDVAVTLQAASTVIVNGVTFTAGQTIATVYTDLDGQFSFSALPDGNYTVTAATPANRVSTYDPDGAPNGSYAVTIASGVTTIAGNACADCGLLGDLGYRVDGARVVSGTLCLEAGSGDASCTTGTNSPLANTTVRLYAGSQLLGETTTDGAGAYTFANLPDGTYTLAVAKGGNPLQLTAPTAGAGVTESPSGATAYQSIVVSGGNAVADFPFAFDVDVDLGDLPTSYEIVTLDEGGAYHVQPMSPTLYLGSSVGSTMTPVQNASANGDADDNGVTFPTASSWTVGLDGGNLTAVASVSGWLVAWIDFNRDGDISDSGEFIVSQAVGAGSNVIAFDIPTGATFSSDMYSRIRLFAGEPAFAQFAYTGEAQGGEVEDYLVVFAPLPVALYDFEARAQACAVALSWRVGAEVNVSHYLVERSVDGASFEAVAEVAAAGRSHYTATVEKGDQAYYRLRTVDLDGTTALSAVIVASGDCAEAFTVRVYPNPMAVGTSLTLELTGVTEATTVTLVDVLGRVAATERLTAGETRRTFSSEHLSAGTYIVQVDDRSTGQRVVVVR